MDETSLRPAESEPEPRPLASVRRFMGLSGYVVVTASCLTGLGGVVYPIVRGYYFEVPQNAAQADLFAIGLQHFGYPLLALLGGAVFGIIGLRLLSAAGRTTNSVIPQEEYELLAGLIAQPNSQAINEYIKLSSLSGFTGTFQKIGFTGLPLATVTVTILFSAMSFLNPQFLELAKLTLGAFIGSFVQQRREGQVGLAEAEGRSLGLGP